MNIPLLIRKSLGIYLLFRAGVLGRFALAEKGFSPLLLERICEFVQMGG